MEELKVIDAISCETDFEIYCIHCCENIMYGTWDSILKFACYDRCVAQQYYHF